MDKRLSSTSYSNLKQNIFYLNFFSGECINFINSSSELNLTTPHTYFGFHADSIKIPEKDKYIYTNFQVKIYHFYLLHIFLYLESRM
jgi:hypothetical protein